MEIKEIEIKTETGYTCIQYAFKEKLRISRHWISYKRIPLDKDLGDSVSWDCKNPTEDFANQFTKLADSATHILNQIAVEEICDAGSFSIVIHYENGKKDVVDYTGSVNDQGIQALRYFANKVLEMVPAGFPYPDCLAHQTIDDISLDDVERYLELSRSRIDGATKLEPENGVYVWQPPVYPEWIWRMLETMLETDFEYTDKVDSLLKKDVSSLSFDEIRTLFTYAYRGEKFCDGLIASLLNDGHITKWLQRLLDLLEAQS